MNEEQEQHRRNLRRDSLHDWSMYFGGIGTGFGIVGGCGLGWTWGWEPTPRWLIVVAVLAVLAVLMSTTLHILRGRVPA